MRTIFAEYNPQCNSIDVYTSSAIRSAWNDANVGKCGRFFNNIAVKGIVLSSNLMIERHPDNTKQYNS